MRRGELIFVRVYVVEALWIFVAEAAQAEGVDAEADAAWKRKCALC